MTEGHATHDFRTHGGSRHFASLPMSVYPRELAQHLAEVPGLCVTEILSAMPTDGSWIDFTYAGQYFSVTDEYGEYWLFVKDPACPDSILNSVAEHCRRLLVRPS